MKTASHPTLNPAVANLYFAALMAALLAGGWVLLPVVGVGTNLWINELIFLLLPVAVLGSRGGAHWRAVFRIRWPGFAALAVAPLIGAGLWCLAGPMGWFAEGMLRGTLGALPSEGVEPGLLQGLMAAFGMLVLAPLCEEAAFRGYVQSAYDAKPSRRAWVWAGVLFGAMHVLNGVGSLIPATLIGLVIGFVAMRTGSLFPGIAIHAVSNFFAIAASATFPALVEGEPLPQAFWFVPPAGLGLVALGVGVVVWLHPGEKQEAVDHAPTAGITGVGALALAMAVVILAGVGYLELSSRTMQHAAPAPGLSSPERQVAFSRITTGPRTDGVLPVCWFDTVKADVGSQVLIDLEVDSTGAKGGLLVLVASTGETAWSCPIEGRLSGRMKTGTVGTTGSWRLEARGAFESLRVSAKVFLAPPAGG